ncbi:MAG: M28 family peptidase [Planctomycetia bacterium]
MAGRAAGGGRAKRAGWTLAAALVATLLLVAWREAPPAPRGEDAPAGEFSATRAAAAWDSLPGATSPHPIGSPAHAALGAALAARLGELGREVRRDEALHARERADGLRIVAPVANIVALLRGTGPADAPLFVLSTHYDSVVAGPGASDAGMGCAALFECARALVERAKQGERLPHDVAFLFSDAEELDLVGAARFAAHDPLAARVGLIHNLEARGTNGLARVFRTTGPQDELVELLARCAPRPSTTSFAVEVFRRLPNDTDVSVYAELGWSALDAAVIGGLARYHTPLDDADHRDARSLQHHGETALALAAGWRGEGAVRSTREADESHAMAWSDVLGIHIVRVPAWSVLPLALGALVACAFLARRAAGVALASAAGALAGAVAAALVCTALVAVLAAGHEDGAPWLARPWAWTMGLGAVAYATGALLARRAGGWASSRGAGGLRGGTGKHEQLAGVVGIWAACAVALASATPGAAAPFLGPAVAGILVLLLLPGRLAALILPCVGLVLVSPLLLGVAEAFGQGLPAALAVPWALLGALAAPRFELAPRLVCLGLGLVGLWVAAFVPTRDAHTPRAGNARYWRPLSVDGVGNWNVGGPPPPGWAPPPVQPISTEESAWATAAAAQLRPPASNGAHGWSLQPPEHAVMWCLDLEEAGTIEVRADGRVWRGAARELRIAGQFQGVVEIVLQEDSRARSLWAVGALGDAGWPWRPALAVPRGRGDEVAIEFALQP